MGNSIPRFQIMARDDFRCIYCGATPRTVELHLDHLVPKSLGGSDATWNLGTSCAPCNLSKSNSMAPDAVIQDVYTRDCAWPYLGRRAEHEPCIHCGVPVRRDTDDDITCVQCESCNAAVCDAYQQGWEKGVAYGRNL